MCVYIYTHTHVHIYSYIYIYITNPIINVFRRTPSYSTPSAPFSLLFGFKIDKFAGLRIFGVLGVIFSNFDRRVTIVCYGYIAAAFALFDDIDRTLHLLPVKQSITLQTTTLIYNVWLNQFILNRLSSIVCGCVCALRRY